MEILYEKYENIQKFITKYRHYTTEEKFLDYSTFKKSMHVDQYIKHKCVDTIKGVLVYIYIFHDNSKYIKTTPQFKRLMDKIPEEPSNVIIISKNELSVYINKSLMKYPHLNIYNYMHKYFTIELTNGPLCSEHVILSNADVRQLCSRELIIHPLSLPSISINDPQNIWVGGELGQVIKITSISEITGKTIRYRIVSPDSGKMINIQNLKNQIQTNDNIQDLKDIEDKKNDELKEVETENTIDDYVEDMSEDESISD
jgi:DNA-directed RNA polymerase subunit H (RpoH/RPB5)